MNADQPKSGRCVRRNWLRFATCGLLVAVLVVAAFFAGRLSMLPRAEDEGCQVEILFHPDAAAEKAKEALVELMRDTKPFAPFKSADEVAEMPLQKAEAAYLYYCGPIWINVEDRTYRAYAGYRDEPWNYWGRFEIRNGRWKAVPTAFIREYLERPRPDGNKPLNNAGEAQSTIAPERSDH